jgi:hypothetical protein
MWEWKVVSISLLYLLFEIELEFFLKRIKILIRGYDQNLIRSKLNF